MVISEASIEHEIMRTHNAKKEEVKSRDILKEITTFAKSIFWRLKNNKEKIKILIPIAGISVLFMIYMITKTVVNIRTLNNETAELYNLNYFNTKVLNNSDYTKEELKGIKTLSELITYETDLEGEIERYNNYLTSLQNPYSNFMKHILLPQLNIWKDPFIWDIDISIVGQKFLEKNPYDDIKLIQQWSNFFKNVWNNNEFNQIEDIIIWDLVEEQESFYIPITVKFIANSKRSFLLLVEKLSATSNATNIALINEFMYTLRENIKEDKKENIKTLTSQYDQDFSEDQTIGYHIYQRVFNNKNNQLINEEIINKTIKETVICGTESNAYCYYKFRDKYRSIPSIAYTIWLENNSNKTKDLKKFLQELAPIISINKFTFDRDIEQSISNYENIQYKGEIQMEIYWKWITDSEVQDIAVLLWQKCLWETITPKAALKKIDSTLVNIGNITQVNTTNTSTLRELQEIIEKIDSSYDKLTNYKKTIKLFEMYRMLQDWNLCEI